MVLLFMSMYRQHDPVVAFLSCLFSLSSEYENYYFNDIVSCSKYPNLNSIY